jgi:hypothetical protein
MRVARAHGTISKRDADGDTRHNENGITSAHEGQRSASCRATSETTMLTVKQAAERKCLSR